MLRGRGRGGAKAPVQPEDGTALGIHRLKRVADFGPPTVGTLPPPRNNKKQRRGGRGGGRGGGPGRGGFANANGLPPTVGTLPSRGRGGRGRGAGAGGRRSRGSSPRGDKNKDKEREGRRDDGYRPRDYGQAPQWRSRDDGRDYGRDNRNFYRPDDRRDNGWGDRLADRRDEPSEEQRRSHSASPVHRSSSPSPLSPPREVWNLSSSPPPRPYSPSQAVVNLISESESEAVDPPLPVAADIINGASPQPVGTDLAPPVAAPPPPAPRPPPKFKPRNHNVRENLPAPPPPPPKEPTPPPPPEPPKFKPKNHNPRKNDPAPRLPPKTTVAPPPPIPIPPPANPSPACLPHHLSQQQEVPPPSGTVASTTTPPATTTDISDSPDVKPDFSALIAAELAALERSPLTPPPRSPPKEGVEWIKPIDIPHMCMTQGQSQGVREQRQEARKAFVSIQRRKLRLIGKQVLSSKWRSDGLAIDWRLMEQKPKEDSDDDFIEVLPAPRPRTPEEIVVVDSPSPSPLPRSSPPSSVIDLAPDLSVPGAVTVSFPPEFRFMPSRRSLAFAAWREAQLGIYKAPMNTVEHFTVTNGLRIRWKPIDGPVASASASSSPSSSLDMLFVPQIPAGAGRAPAPVASLASSATTSTNFAAPSISGIQARPSAAVPVLSSPITLSAAGSTSSPSAPTRTGPKWATASSASDWIDPDALHQAVEQATSAVLSRPAGLGNLTGSSLGLFSSPATAAPPSLPAPSAVATPTALLTTLSPRAIPPATAAATGASASQSPFDGMNSPTAPTTGSAGTGTPQPPAPAAERLARLQTQLNVLFDRIDRWMRLQEDFPERAEQLQRQIERTEHSIFDVQNQMDMEKRKIDAERM